MMLALAIAPRHWPIPTRTPRPPTRRRLRRMTAGCPRRPRRLSRPRRLDTDALVEVRDTAAGGAADHGGVHARIHRGRHVLRFAQRSFRRGPRHPVSRLQHRLRCRDDHLQRVYRWITPLGVDVALKPGLVNIVPVYEIEFTGTDPWVMVSNFHVSIDGCVGRSFIRSYATLTKLTDGSASVLMWVSPRRSDRKPSRT